MKKAFLILVFLISLSLNAFAEKPWDILLNQMQNPNEHYPKAWLGLKGSTDLITVEVIVLSGPYMSIRHEGGRIETIQLDNVLLMYFLPLETEYK